MPTGASQLRLLKDMVRANRDERPRKSNGTGKLTDKHYRKELRKRQAKLYQLQEWLNTKARASSSSLKAATRLESHVDSEPYRAN